MKNHKIPEKIIPITTNKESGLINLINPWLSSIEFSRSKIEITGTISDEPGFLNQIEVNKLKIRKNKANFKNLLFGSLEKRKDINKERHI